MAITGAGTYSAETTVSVLTDTKIMFFLSSVAMITGCMSVVVTHRSIRKQLSAPDNNTSKEV